MNRRKFMVGAGSIGLTAITSGAFLGAAEKADVDPVEALKRGPSGLTRIETEITNPVDREAYVDVRFAVYDEEGELLNDRFSGYNLDAGETREVSVVVPAEHDEADSYSVRIREVE